MNDVSTPPATPHPDPFARAARLMLARGWDASVIPALFDGLAVAPEYPAGIAAAMAAAGGAR
jgi:hypothetical protein